MRNIVILIATVSVILFSGCNTDPRFMTYNKNIPAASTAMLDKKIIVLPFTDCRPESDDFAMLFLFAIPLCPYGYADYQYPEIAKSFATVHSFQFNPPEDLAKVFVAKLNKSAIFNNVEFSFSADKTQADYFLTGTINSLEYQGKRFSYCLSYAGAVFWLLGAPVATSSNRLAITLFLKDKDNKIVWQYTFDKKDDMTQWIYNKIFSDCNMYSVLADQAANEAILDMASKLRNK